jgi:hypothetical protein
MNRRNFRITFWTAAFYRLPIFFCCCRPLASVFGFCRRDVTQDVTRCECRTCCSRLSARVGLLNAAPLIGTLVTSDSCFFGPRSGLFSLGAHPLDLFEPPLVPRGGNRCCRYKRDSVGAGQRKRIMRWRAHHAVRTDRASVRPHLIFLATPGYLLATRFQDASCPRKGPRPPDRSKSPDLHTSFSPVERIPGT